MEREHMLILGFSPKALSLISEICDALESEGGGTIVVMDDLDRQFMEQQLKVLSLNNVQFICASLRPTTTFTSPI
jgi:hypothetical protein